MARLRNLVAGAALGMGLSDQAAITEALNDLFAPTDRHDSVAFYRKVAGSVADGRLPTHCLVHAVERAICGRYRRPGAVLVHVLRVANLVSSIGEAPDDQEGP